MIDQKIAENLIQDYFQFLSEKNSVAWISLFSEDAMSYDPVGNPPNLIQQTYGKFFELLSLYREIKSYPEQMFFAGNEMAVQWKMNVKTHSEKNGTVAGISIFTFDSSGKITQIKAYWDEQSLFSQIR